MKTKIIVPLLAVLTGLSIFYFVSIIKFMDAVFDSSNGPAIFLFVFIALIVAIGLFAFPSEKGRYINSTEDFLKYKQWDRRTDND